MEPYINRKPQITHGEGQGCSYIQLTTPCIFWNLAFASLIAAATDSSIFRELSIDHTYRLVQIRDNETYLQKSHQFGQISLLQACLSLPHWFLGQTGAYEIGFRC